MSLFAASVMCELIFWNGYYYYYSAIKAEEEKTQDAHLISQQQCNFSIVLLTSTVQIPTTTDAVLNNPFGTKQQQCLILCFIIQKK